MSTINVGSQLQQLNQMQQSFNEEMANKEKVESGKDSLRKTLSHSLKGEGPSSDAGSKSAVVLMLLATTTSIDDRNKVSCAQGDALVALGSQIDAEKGKYNTLAASYDNLSKNFASGSVDATGMMDEQVTLKAQMFQEDQASKEMTTKGSQSSQQINMASATNVELANNMKNITRTVIDKEGNFKK